MKHRLLPHCLTLLMSSVLLMVLACGCSREGPENPVMFADDQLAVEAHLNVEAVARDLVAASGWEAPTGPAKADEATAAVIVDFSRTTITGNIAHYAWRIRVGDGTYDEIGLHRVVAENSRGRPERTVSSIFLQHGSSKEFVGMFLPGLYSDTTPDDFGFAVYLAANGVDVWGIDQAWTLVPGSETELAFMADWGLERQLRDLKTAVGIAHAARKLTGNGNPKMILAGYSNGIPTTVSLVNDETQLPPGQRLIGGYIPIDCPLRVASGNLRDVLVYYGELYQSFVDAGGAAEPVIFQMVAELVRCCPDDPSPFDPSFSNLQYALLISAGPVLFPGETFHYWSPVTGDDGLPTSLRFTSWELWLDFLASGTSWEPYIWTVDWTRYVAGVLDTPHDDYLDLIEVPVLNVTPVGGFAESTYYGLGLLASRDVQTLMPGTGLPATEDFAHIDLFTSSDAEGLVWQPVLEWIINHTHAGNREISRGQVN